MISVIVPTYNREECLYKMLQSINEQKNATFEVLVIDQSDEVTEDKINKTLEETIHTAFESVHQTAEKYNTDFRTGAYILAVGRVVEATKVRGIFP